MLSGVLVVSFYFEVTLIVNSYVYVALAMCQHLRRFYPLKFTNTVSWSFSLLSQIRKGSLEYIY